MRSSVVEPRPSPDSVAHRRYNASRPEFPPPYPQQQIPKPPAPAARRHIPLAPGEGWLSMGLLAVAVYSVVFSIMAANWVGHSFILIWSTAAGLLLGLIIAKISRFPQTILHLAACLVGHWLSIWLTSMIAYHISWLLLLANLREVINGGFTSSVSSSSEMVFLFYLSFLCFFLGYFGAWLIYRAHLPWLVALVYCAIMLVNLNYVKQDFSYLVIIMLGALILLIARIQLANQLNQWMNEGLNTDRAWLKNIHGRFIQITALFALLILPVGWLLPAMGQPAAGAAFWNNLDNAWTNITHGQLSLNGPATLFQPYQSPANFFGDSLRISGSVKLPNGEVLYYTSPGHAQGQYLEGFTYDHFDGHTWSSTFSNEAQQYAAGVPLPLDTPGEGIYNQITTSVTILLPPGGPKHYIFAPAQPSTFDVATLLYGNSFTTAWTQQDPLISGEHYSATSLVSTARDSDLSSIPLPRDNQQFWSNGPNGDTLSMYYLQTPDDLSPGVLQTARQWTQGATNAYDAVKMLETHLNNPAQFTYSIDNPPVPDNVDAVDWLLQTRSGYCTYYASAMTIMARLLGIPARVVNGFSSGHFDAKRNAWVVDGTDAHSWVQVYFPGYGWINFDPTPGFSANGVTTKASPTPVATEPPVKATPTVPGKHPSPVARHTPVPGSSSGGINGTSPGDLVRQALFLGFSLLILLASMFVLFIAITRYRARKARAPAPSLVSGIFWRICRLASLAGLPPQQWQTPYEYSRTLSRHYPNARASLRRLTELFVRERWATPSEKPRSAETRDVEKIWLSLRNKLLRSFIMRLPRPRNIAK